MALQLRPRDNTFYDLLTEAGRNVAVSASTLLQLTDPNANRTAIAKELREREHAGDTITHRIMSQLNKSFVTPFDRDDIYRLTSALDDVVDLMEEATDFIELTELGALPQLMIEQIRLLQRSAEETSEAMSRLRTLTHLEPYWIEVNRLENEADRVHRKLVSRLFTGEFEMLTMLKLREVADLLEDAADALERVAHAVESIAVKES